MLIILQAPATHLYPGLRGRAVADAAASSQSWSEEVCDCVVEFSDGAHVYGSLEPEQDGLRWLALKAHATARGTAIPPKRWHLEITTDRDGTLHFCVAARGLKGTAPVI